MINLVIFDRYLGSFKAHVCKDVSFFKVFFKEHFSEDFYDILLKYFKNIMFYIIPIDAKNKKNI